MAIISQKTEIDKVIEIFEKAFAFQVDDNLCFGSIGNDGEQWTIAFDVNDCFVEFKEDDFWNCNCKGNSFDIWDEDGEEFNITPLFSEKHIANFI